MSFATFLLVVLLLVSLYALYKVRDIHLRVHRLGAIEQRLLDLEANHRQLNAEAQEPPGTHRVMDKLYRHIAMLENRFNGCPPFDLVLPVPVPDHQGSPHSGLSREGWLEIARAMLSGALTYTRGMSAPLSLPPSLAAGYPGVHSDPLRGTQEAYLEGFARTLFLAAPLLVNDPSLQLYGKSVADYYRDYLLRGVRRFDIATFGWLTVPNLNQRIVEAAGLTVSLTVARNILWEPLTTDERDTIARWLHQFAEIEVIKNNWLWFPVLINTFLKREGYSYCSPIIERSLEAIRGLHVDGGWFRDGDSFDFYCGWALQFYPIFWASWDGDSYPELRDEFYKRNDQFLASYPHLFSRSGFMPVWGRSICYRFAAAAPLAVAFMRPTAPALDPGFARRLCSGNLLQFADHPNFLCHGVPSLGFYGEDRTLIDDYSCSASPYWCAKLFTALLLPAESPFWTATENEGFWSDPSPRFELGTTGMWVEHDASTGQSRLFAPQEVHRDDARYRAPWFDTADVNYKSTGRRVAEGILS
ncbi:MAG: hypothetical protein FD174_174 [Geobacteraceae bacterium]|nr:MAG: hypothetical protein FD174_174 [Geobacteraceae bacterium]